MQDDLRETRSKADGVALDWLERYVVTLRREAHHRVEDVADARSDVHAAGVFTERERHQEVQVQVVDVFPSRRVGEGPPDPHDVAGLEGGPGGLLKRRAAHGAFGAVDRRHPENRTSRADAA